MDQKRTEAAARLQDLVAPARLTQAALAEDLGVTQQAVNNWIHGRSKPSLDMAVKIAERTGIPVEAWARPEDDAAKTGTEG